MLPVTDATLTSNISAGISYINGVRVETNSTAHTYTASKDTYVYIGANGSFSFEEVANGASAPATPANSLLLATVITDSDNITSVTDSRTLSIAITANSSNFAADYRDQAFIIRDSTTAVHAEPGQISVGNTFYTITTDTSSLSTATAGNWIEGAAPILNNLKFYVYAYNNSGTTWALKYASADPVNSDTSSNTGGTLRYYTTGGTTYRVLAWISADSTGAIQTYNFSNWADKGIINQVTYQTSTLQTTTATTPYDNTIPQISEGAEFMNIPFKPTNANSKLIIEAGSQALTASANTEIVIALHQDTTADALQAGVVEPAAAANENGFYMKHVVSAASTTLRIYRIRMGTPSGSTISFNGQAASAIFLGTSNSFLRVTEVEG